MPNRAELQVELRELVAGGGFGRLPICRMTKTDLEAHVIAVRQLKEKANEVRATLPPTKNGPTGPRKIPVETEEIDEDDEVIKVPGQPPAKLQKAPLVNKPREVKAPVPKKSPAPKKDIKTVTIEEPASGKSSKVAYYPGGCPTCGKH
jgi:hypothetical protein